MVSSPNFLLLDLPCRSLPGVFRSIVAVTKVHRQFVRRRARANYRNNKQFATRQITGSDQPARRRRREAPPPPAAEPRARPLAPLASPTPQVAG